MIEFCMERIHETRNISKKIETAFKNKQWFTFASFLRFYQQIDTDFASFIVHILSEKFTYIEFPFIIMA